MRPRFPWFLFFFFTINHGIHAQSFNKDSASKEITRLQKLPADSGTARQLRDIAYDLLEQDSALSRFAFELALSKSLASKDADAVTNSYRMLGIWYMNFDYKDKAMDNYRASLSSANSNHNNYLAAGANFNIGNIKYAKGEYDSCIDYYLKAVSLFEDPAILNTKTLTEKILDKKKSDLYSNISAVFNQLKNLTKADEYIDKAIAIAKKYNSPAAKDAMAYYMQQKADNFSLNGDKPKALSIRLQYLSQMEQGQAGKTSLQAAYQNIAREYFELGKTDSAHFFASKSLQTANEINSADGAASANLLLATIALKQNQFSIANNYLQQCSAYYNRTDDPAEKRSYYDVMRQVMFAEGNYKEAYNYLEKFNAVNDSILNSERARQFAEREGRFQSEKKDNQIKLQQADIKQKNTINYILIGTALMILTVSLMGYRNYKQKQKIHQQRITELEKEKQLMATEAVLKGEEQERTRLAKDLHDGLGGLLSGIKYSFQSMKGNLVMTAENAQAFERSMDMLDSSIKEMRRVAHNLMPEALVKFGLDTALKDFCNDINQSGALKISYQSIGLEGAVIEQTTTISIYRIIQELINNVLKHAAANNAIVQVSKTNNNVSITVEDDGKGFDQSQLEQAAGIGWNNIKHRVDLLKGKLDVNSQPGQGTSVLIEFLV